MKSKNEEGFIVTFSGNQFMIYMSQKQQNFVYLYLKKIFHISMGNKETKHQPIIKHAIYGQPEHLVTINDQKYHTVFFPVKQQQEGKDFCNQSNVTESFNKKHLLLPTHFTFERVFMCTNSSILGCTFPYFPISLQQQIKQRSEAKNYLSKQELINIVYQIIDGARNFDRSTQKVGDIRPSQILLDESKRNIKLVNYFTSPHQLTGLDKTYQAKQKTLLAPEQLKSLSKNILKPQINVHKADSFSLGLTILSIGNLKLLENDLYNYENYVFSWTQLNQQLDVFQSRYGHFLTEIVKGFVQNEPRSRLYAGEIGAILQFYEKHIYQMISFQPDYLLLQKSYNLNYSGPRSQQFLSWLKVCQSYLIKRQQPISRTEYHNIITTPPKQIVYEQPIRYSHNIKVRFEYTSPSVIKKEFQYEE